MIFIELIEVATLVIVCTVHINYVSTSLKLLFKCCCINMRPVIQSIIQFYPRMLQQMRGERGELVTLLVVCGRKKEIWGENGCWSLDWSHGCRIGCWLCCLYKTSQFWRDQQKYKLFECGAATGFLAVQHCCLMRGRRWPLMEICARVGSLSMDACGH